MPAPTIRPSAMGVSRTRVSPNSRSRPCVTAYEPPQMPTSSPMINTRSSRVISSRSASRIASRYVISAMLLVTPIDVDVLEERLGRWGGAVVGKFGDRIDLGAELAIDLLERAFVEDAFFFE